MLREVAPAAASPRSDARTRGRAGIRSNHFVLTSFAFAPASVRQPAQIPAVQPRGFDAGAMGDWMGRYATVALVALAGLLLVVPLAHADCCKCQGATTNVCGTVGAQCGSCAAACAAGGLGSMLACCPGTDCSGGVADSCTSGKDICAQTASGPTGFCQGMCPASPTPTGTATATATPGVQGCCSYSCGDTQRGCAGNVASSDCKDICDDSCSGSGGCTGNSFAGCPDGEVLLPPLFCSFPGCAPMCGTVTPT
jgi:hypothetical protein